jgi:hypothetical protein
LVLASRVTFLKPMSALRPKADISLRHLDICEGPTADIPSFDQFAGARPGNERFDAQNQFKLVCLFDLSNLCHSGL